MAASPGSLYELLDELLTYAATALDTIPSYPETVDLDGAPATRFITAGLPAIDCCPAMWAYAGPVTPAPSGPSRGALDSWHKSGAYQRVNLPTLNLLVMRCVPGFGSGPTDTTLPSSLALATVARQVYADGWCLWVELNRAIKDGLLFERCKEARLESGVPQDPSGGCAGWLMTITVNLGGYPSL